MVDVALGSFECSSQDLWCDKLQSPDTMYAAFRSGLLVSWCESRMTRAGDQYIGMRKVVVLFSQSLL
jgi:hypothetical protein